PFPTRRSSDLPLPGHELVERIDLALDLDAGLLRRVLARVIRGHGHERIHRVKIRLAGREPAAGQQQEHSASHARCKSMSHGQSPPCFLLTCFSITQPYIKGQQKPQIPSKTSGPAALCRQVRKYFLAGPIGPPYT